MTSFFPWMFNEIPKRYILHVWLSWIFSFMIPMVMSWALVFNYSMMPRYILLSLSYPIKKNLMIWPFCEGFYPNHSRNLLLHLSLALFFSFLHLSDDLSFHNIFIILAIIFCLVWGSNFPFLSTHDLVLQCSILFYINLYFSI